MNLRATLVNKKNRVRGCFYDFCKQTILHGWHYLVHDKDSGAGEAGKQRQQAAEKAAPTSAAAAVTAKSSNSDAW